VIELSADKLRQISEDDYVTRNFLRRRFARTYSDFREALEDDLLSAIQQLELNPQQHPQSDSEDHTTQWIVDVLWGMGYSVSHNAQQGGNVDITVEQQRMNFRWIAEAKKFSDVGDLREGYLQLSTRYRAVPDENGILHGGLIGYLYRPNPKACMDGWRAHFVESVVDSCSVVDCSRRPAFGSFVSEHPHVSLALPLRVWHLCVALHFLPEDASGRSAQKYRAAREETR
jgi:hypothetical protein